MCAQLEYEASGRKRPPLLASVSHTKTTTYLKESENLLLVFSIHISFLKQREVWNKSIAWSDMPGIQRGQLISGHASERLVARAAALHSLGGEEIKKLKYVAVASLYGT